MRPYFTNLNRYTRPPVIPGAPRTTGNALSRLALTLLMVVLVACGPRGSESPQDPSDPTPTTVPTYVGTVTGSDAQVAVLIDGNWLTVYTCGGEESWETHTGWFYGLPDGDSFDLQYAGLHVSGRFDEERSWGTLTLADGTELEFDAPRAEPDTAAGIYYRQQNGDRTGLIVTNALSATGVRYRYNENESAPVTVEDDLRPEPTDHVTVSSMGDSYTVSQLERSVQEPPEPEPDPGMSGRVEIISDDAVLLSQAGDSYQLEATVYDDEGRPNMGARVSWSSSNPDQVQVDENGLVTAREDLGYAVIEASFEGAEPAQATILIATLTPETRYIQRDNVIDMDSDTQTVTLRRTEEAEALQIGEIIASNAGFAGHILEITEHDDTVEVNIEIASIADVFNRLEINHVGEPVRLSGTLDDDQRATFHQDQTLNPQFVPSFQCDGGYSWLDISLTGLEVEIDLTPTLTFATDDDGVSTFTTGIAGEMTLSGPILSLLLGAGASIDCFGAGPSLPININFLIGELGPIVRPTIGLAVKAKIFEGPNVTFHGPTLTLDLTTTTGVMIDADGSTLTPITTGGPAVVDFDTFSVDLSQGDGYKFDLKIGPYLGLQVGVGALILGQPVQQVTLLRPRFYNNYELDYPIQQFQIPWWEYSGPNWRHVLGGEMTYGVLDIVGVIDKSKTMKFLGIKAPITAVKINFFEHEWATSPTPTVEVSITENTLYGDDVQLRSTIPNNSVNLSYYDGSLVEFYAFEFGQGSGVLIGTAQLTALPGELVASTDWSVDIEPGRDYTFRAMLYGSTFSTRPYPSAHSDPMSIRRSISISPNTGEVAAEEMLDFTVELLGEEADSIEFDWSATGGEFFGDASSNVKSWSSELAGDFEIKACIDDDPDVCATASVEVFATIELTPEFVILESNASETFTATVKGFEDNSVNWSVSAGHLDEGATEATYTAPDVAGVFWLRATSVEDPGLRAFAEIRVDEVSMLPYVSISNVNLAPHPRFDDQFVMSFDAAWSNSWFEDKRPFFVESANSWDALWVFAKYSLGDGVWHHVQLNSNQSDLNQPSHADVRVARFDDDSSAGPGAFIDRVVREDDNGVFRVQNVELGWDDQEPGVVGRLVSFKVFAIEMAYVPTESFTAGSTGHEARAFDKTTIENRSDLPEGYVASNWPNGYRNFYLMKYPLMQWQYAGFLNTLEPELAELRYPIPESERYALELDGTQTYRSQLPFVPMHQLGWEDAAAFAAWAGLRPITELEYEKVARGPLEPIVSEFAWGSTEIVPAEGISDAGTLAEAASNAEANAVFASLIAGPIRAGSLAQAADTREQAGAGYYGALELSGNTWEHVVRLLREDNVFNGRHGDGTLTPEGTARVEGWPEAGDRATILRGGSWLSDASSLMLADRSEDSDGSRRIDAGWRGGRTAP